jgi:ABC-2 type transport system ATP-binding protein
MIEAIDLQKTFGSFQAVRGLNLQVESGEVIALLGPNGAGKTTTVRMLSAILRPTGGQARIDGYDVVRDARKVRNIVGLLTEFPGLYQRMRPIEYLQFFGELQGMTVAASRARGEHLLKQFGLWEAREKRLDSYSKGMKQKVALIRALIHDPPVLFLDEPTTAMDPHSARIVRDAIAELRAARRTILLTTHNLTEAEALADRIVIVRGGTIIAEGTRAQLTRQLLGDPIWELQVAGPVAPAVPLLAGLAPLEAQGDEWLHYRCTDPRGINPQLLARLAAQQIAVIGLAELPRRLEDVYLSIIADDTERGIWSEGATTQPTGDGRPALVSAALTTQPGSET